MLPAKQKTKRKQLPPDKQKTKRNKLPYQLRVRCEHRDLDENPSTSAAAAPKPQKSKTQMWRDKVAITDPAKRKRDSKGEMLYSRFYRAHCAAAEATLKKRNLSAKEKAEAEKWDERKKRNNETARLRMKKMNDKKKAEGLNKPKTKTLTRQQHDKQKSKATTNKRNQRAGYSDEKKRL